MPESTTPQLTGLIAEIEARDAIMDGWHQEIVILSPDERDALIRDWRALREENEQLKNVTIPDSISDLVRRIDAAIRFSVPIQQQIKLRGFINELIFLNAALREQLAEAQQGLLRAAINEANVWKAFLRSSGIAPEGDDSADDWAILLSSIVSQCDELQSQLAQVTSERELCLQVQKRGTHSSVTCPCVIAMEKSDDQLTTNE